MPGPLHSEQGGRKERARCIHVPRGVEDSGGEDCSLSVAFHAGARERVESGGVGELLLRSDIRIEQRFRPERLFRFTDGGAKEGWRGDRERPRRDRLAGEELGALSTREGTVPARSNRPKVAFLEGSPREDEGWMKGCGPVSYTHLTLPTIYSV